MPPYDEEVVVEMASHWDASFDALSRSLSWPEDRWIEGTLTLSEAATALHSWANARAFHAGDPAKKSWDTLREDFRLASCAAGRNLRGAVQSELSAAQGRLRVKKDYSAILIASRVLLERLRTGAAMGAAWDDLVDASADSDFATFAHLRDTFISLARHNSHDLSSFGTHDTVNGVLHSYAGSIRDGQILVGFDPIPDPEDSQEVLSLSKDYRLSLARRVWSSVGRQATNVVWIAYKNTNLQSVKSLKVGQVTFWPLSSLSQHINNGDDTDEPLPPESYTDIESTLESISSDDEARPMIARIDLGLSSVGTAVSTGFRVVEAVLDLMGRRGSEWQEAGLRIHFVDGKPNAYSRSNVDFERERWKWDDEDSVSKALKRENGRHEVLEFSENMRNVLNIRKEMLRSGKPESNTIGSIVRGLEIIRVELEYERAWTEFVTEYLRDQWVSRAIHIELSRAVDGALDGGYSHWRRDGEDSNEFEALTRAFWSTRRSGWKSVCDRSIPFQRSLDPHWLPARRLKRANWILSSSDAPRLIAQHIKRFDMLVLRAYRCRNIQVHGGPDLESSSESCLDFVMQLGRVAFKTYVEAVALGRPPLEEFISIANMSKNELKEIREGRFRNLVTP